MTEENPQKKHISLSFKNHYRHFLLIHDFFFKLTKTKAKNADFFDLQVEVYNGMKNSVDVGCKIFQGIAFCSLSLYFLRGNSIKLRFFYGFLFTYWYNHIMNLGAYAGAFARIPSLFNKTAIYYEKHPQQKNLLSGLVDYMQTEETCEQPQIMLSELFNDQKSDKSYVSNDFFIKNKEKYFTSEMLEQHLHQSNKLPYLDSFLSRYVYYSFTRWCTRVGQMLSLDEQ